jgi:RNA polymerase sigma-54 factor
MIGNKDISGYIKEKLNNARFLLKALENRKSSLRRVSEAILERQHAFFNHGPSRLEPMILKDVASQLGIHESTVSRVVTDKYLSCSMGVYELKFFFSSSIRSMDGDGVASEVLKLKIKEIVGHEDKHRPLSDAKIAELLRRQNIKVARRTVTKYREVLNISDYRKRKEKR